MGGRQRTSIFFDIGKGESAGGVKEEKEKQKARVEKKSK